MNDDFSEPTDREGWLDRLVDRGLAETLGGDAPPDLQERILAAARAEGVLASPVNQETTMATVAAPRGWNRRSTLVAICSGVLAAGVLLALVLPAHQAARQSSQTTAERNVEFELREAERRERYELLKKASQVLDSKTTQGSTSRELDDTAAESLTAQSARPASDQEIEDLLSVLSTKGISKDESDEAAAKLKVMVTPQVVVNEEAEVQLQGEDPSRVLRGVVRRNLNSLGVDGSSDKLAGSTPPADYGIAMHHWSVSADQRYTRGADGATPLLSESPSSPASQQSPANHADFDSLLDLVTSTVDQPANDVDRAAIDSRLSQLRQERDQLEVMRQAAANESGGSSVREKAVQEAINANPMVQNYRKQLFAIDQEVAARKAVERRKSSPMIDRLQQQKAQVAALEAKYRATQEQSLRDKYRNLPALSSLDEAANHRATLERLNRQIAELEQGLGPDQGGDQYARVVDNPFKSISLANTDNRLSTFSIDVDTAAYANVRQFLMESRQLPPADAVRIEELVNYFPYDYAPPAASDEAPFAAHVETAACPWNDAHRLVRIGVKGRELDRRARPQSNLVFLVDVSGSMNEPNKLPLVVEGLRMLAGELGENDRVAIVVYASSEGLALPSTPGTQKERILAVLDSLQAGGSTAGGAGIQLAYQIALDNFVKGGVNRVILCTDGDFNVGVTSPAELERLAEAKAKETGVFLTVLGFGRGNLNDAMMEQISNKGNGNYHYVDNQREARKVLVEEMTGTLVTIAKDVKLQVEFNPAQVAGYRLIGYENRVLAAEDFNDDKKDAGEIGAGHAVTALYEVIPAGQQVDVPGVDELKYAAPASGVSSGAEVRPADDESQGDELCTLKIRYKQPDGEVSAKLEFPVVDEGEGFAAASDDFQFAAAVASFGMLLRDSPYKGQASFGAVAEIAESASRDRDPHGYRREFIELVRRAGELKISN